MKKDTGAQETGGDGGGDGGDCVDADLNADPLNCGSCGHSCLGGPCSAATCQAYVVDQYGSPYGVAVHGSRFYVSDRLDQGIVSCDIAQGCDFTSIQVAPSSTPVEGFLAFDKGSTLYAGTGNALWSVYAGVTTLVDNDYRLIGVAPSGTHIYFTDTNGLNICDAPSCANVQTLYAGDGGIVGVATDGTTIYVTDYNGIYSVDMNGQNPKQISTVGRPWAVAVDGSRLYFTRYDADTLDMCDVSACDTTRSTLFSYGVGSLGYGVAYDSVSVFVAEGHSNKVWRVAKP